MTDQKMPLKDLIIRFVKFGIVGFSGVFVNLGIYALLTRALGAGDSMWSRNIAYAFSVELSIFTNFILNDVWTFQDRRQEQSWWSRLVRFHLVSLVGFAINWGVFVGINWLLARTGGTMAGEVVIGGKNLGNLDDLIAACIGIGAAMFWNFFGNLLFTWTGRAAILALALLPAAAMAQPVGPRTGPVEQIDFQGWAPDNQTFGYKLDRWDAKRKKVTHFFVRKKTGSRYGRVRSKPVRLPGESFPAYFKKNKYRKHPITVRGTVKRKLSRIYLPDERRLRLELVTEKKMTLHVWFEEGTEQLLLYKLEFDEIYFAFDAVAWLSPNGMSLAVVLHLDADIRLDATVLTLNLPPREWRKITPPMGVPRGPIPETKGVPDEPRTLVPTDPAP